MLRDSKVFAKAAASNLLARFAPSLYVSLTRQTGRGGGETDADEIADYFFRCVDDYRDQLGLDDEGFDRRLRGARVLEYGPGDVLGVALILYARGAERVDCVDRFPLERPSDLNLAVYGRILERVRPEHAARARSAFRTPGQPGSGFRDESVRYCVTRDGLAGQQAATRYDFVISRAVLEHVHHLEETIGDVRANLAPGGISIHNVDLRSHNLDRSQPFDFLAWPDWAYRVMYSHKGFPNRHRIDRYRRAIEEAGLQATHFKPTAKLPAEDIERLRRRLARPFRAVSSEELRWMGFWMILELPRDASRGSAP